MTLKCGVTVQAATSATNQQIGDSNAGFSTDIKAIINVLSRQSVWNGTSSYFAPCMGFAGKLGGAAAMGIYTTDNVATQDTGAICVNDTAIVNMGTTGGSSNIEFTVTNWEYSANQVELTYSDAGDDSTLFGALLLGGDIEAKVVRTFFTNAAAPDTQTVAHGLSGAPEVIIAISNEATSPPDDSDRNLLGFWANSEYAASAIVNPSGTTAPAGQSAQTVATDCIGGRISTAGVLSPKYTISNVDADSFDFSTSSSATQYTEFLCMRGTTTPLVAKVGVYTTPAGTGNASMGLSMSAAPKILLMIPTRCLAVDTAYADGNAGQFGLMMACNNDGVGTEYAGVSASNEDGSTNTDCLTRGTSDAILVGYSNTSGALYTATVNQWQAGDVQLNFSVAASGYKIPYLAIGQATTSVPAVTNVPDLYGNNVATVTGTDFGASRGNGQVYICPTDDVDDADRVAQTILSWTDTSIVITAVRGNLNYNTNLYLFVVEDGGTSNPSGYVVQIKSGITLTWTA